MCVPAGQKRGGLNRVGAPQVAAQRRSIAPFRHARRETQNSESLGSAMRCPARWRACETRYSASSAASCPPFEMIEALLGDELTTRQSRRIKMALQTARLSTSKSSVRYDISFQPK